MIYFFTYGDENYSNSKIRIEQEAKNCGFLDNIKIYNREDIDDDFLKKTNPYINMHRGGGYWLWKPFFLKKTFDSMDEGDYCIYADAGCTINPYGKERLEYYLSLLDNNDSGIFRYCFGQTAEKLFTNQKVFEYFGKADDEDFQNTDCLMATILLFKKNKNSVEYINKLLKIAEDIPVLFSDEFNEYKKSPKFHDHRHDQSVSSCLTKLENNPIIFQDETYAPDMDGWNNLVFNIKVPFLATRIRG